MALQTFDQAATTGIASIYPGAILAGSSTGALSALQTNGSGQLELINQSQAVGVLQPSGNDNVVYLNANYAGTSGAYVGALGRASASNQGYRIIPNSISGGTLNSLRAAKDGGSDGFPVLSTPVSLATAGYSVHYDSGTSERVITIYDGLSVSEEIRTADASPPAGTLSGFVIARSFGFDQTLVQLEALEDGVAPAAANIPASTLRNYTNTANFPDGNLDYRVTRQSDNAELVAWTTHSLVGGALPQIDVAASVAGVPVWLHIRRGSSPDWTGGTAKIPVTLV